jgi:hypothetical protein
MGIRFYCPNGHKMNVKDFQAGQKGFCPVCGVKMRIPLQSTRASSRHNPSQTLADTPTPPEGTSELAPPMSPPLPAAGAPANLFSPAPTSDMADPLAAAGDALWYVRPSSGGQFGPATADIMRGWLAEGRVSADAFVWREGWRDWQEPSRAFPQLSPRLIIPGLEAMYLETMPAPAHSRPHKRKSLARKTQMTVIAGLVVTVLVLFFIFLVVLFKQ